MEILDLPAAVCYNFVLRECPRGYCVHFSVRGAGTMVSELSTSAKVVGAKQTRRTLEGGKAVKVFLAADADPRVTQPLAELAREKSVPVEQSGTMKELGKACGVAVGAAVAALVRA